MTSRRFSAEHSAAIRVTYNIIYYIYYNSISTRTILTFFIINPAFRNALHTVA
jgi:hypothetical protein